MTEKRIAIVRSNGGKSEGEAWCFGEDVSPPVVPVGVCGLSSICSDDHAAVVASFWRKVGSLGSALCDDF